MAEYELAVLIDQGLEIDLEKATSKVEKIIADNSGKIVNTDNWGKRKLAYPINKQEFAIYIFYTLELEPKSVKAINGVLNITDEVIRFLITKPDVKKRAKAEELKAIKLSKNAENEEERKDSRDSKES